MKGKKLFFKNAAVLTAASLILKTIGMVLRVWLSSRLLSEGLGLYQLIVSVYLLASKPLTAGLETAVTKVASEGRRRNDRVARTALLLALPVSVAVALGVAAFAKAISAHLLCDTRATLAVRILAISIPFMALSAVMKGYFISRRNTLPQSLTQILEQTTRIGAVIFFVSLWQDRGLDMLCAAVLLGDVVAEAVSFAAIYLWGKIDMRKLKSEPPGAKGSAAALARVAVPVSSERAVTTAFHTAENLLVPTVAAAVCGGREAAISLFGVLKGMALPLLFFPSSFLAVFSTLLIPEMASARAAGHLGRLQRAVGNTFHIILTFSVLLGALFLFFADQLGLIIYGSREASYMIRVLAPIVPFMYCESIADGMMKGLGRQVKAFWSGVIDAVARLGLVFLLVPLKGMDGFLIIMLLSNTLAAIYKVSQVLSCARMKADIGNWMLKPITAALVSGAISSFLCGSLGQISNILFVAVAGGLTALLYFTLLFLSRAFDPRRFIGRLKSGS